MPFPATLRPTEIIATIRACIRHATAATARRVIIFLKRVAIFQIRSPRFSFLFLRMSLSRSR
jgi:hypothetical protein